MAGTDGSRIKLIMGATGEDYLLLLDEESAEGHEWQSRCWTTGHGGLPNGLASQLNNLQPKGRHATAVSFGPGGEWYVNGVKRDGSGGHNWWGGTDHGETIQNESRKDPIKVSFGDSGSMVIITGRNGYAYRGNVDDDLVARIKRINSHNKTIQFVRLIRGHGWYAYFMSDDEGTAWKGLGEHLAKEVKSGGSDPVLDVVVAADGAWVVLRPNRFRYSNGVSSELVSRLSEFYREQKARREGRNAKIREHDERIAREAEERRQAEEARRAEEARKAAEEARKREVEDARKRAVEQSLKRRSEQDLVMMIDAKRLRHGMQVTAIGRSLNLGDAFVVSSGRHGVEVHCSDGSRIKTSDPSELLKIVPYMEHEEATAVEDLKLVYMASDEYEAAVSVYHCACTHNRCVCTRTAFVSTAMGPTQSVPRARPLEFIVAGDSNASPLRRPFDEYICAEKLDHRRLLKVVGDLKTDKAQRNACINNLEAKLLRTSTPQLIAQQKVLKRCQVLGAVADTLLEMTQELVEDAHGYVIHEVMYEHKDPSFRGRLFAKGPEVSVRDDKYPRTATLQSMPRDLRNVLVGSFAHDIDCENSEYRLICSLATQLRLEKLIPTVISYRDQRKSWLDMICQKHGVSVDDAKRLPNIILSSGVYSTWLRLVNRTASPSHDPIRKFANNLAGEIRALRHQLLSHPRFGWTAIDREHLRSKGKPDGTIDALLLPRIIQSCENEVLGIIHRSLYDSGWYARAKVFDGLIVDRAVGVQTADLNGALVTATNVCVQRGWGVVLTEKPLHGLQDRPVEAITAAREVMRQLGH